MNNKQRLASWLVAGSLMLCGYPSLAGANSLNVELENFSGQSQFSPFSVKSDISASGGKYIVWADNGDQVLKSASNSSSGLVAVKFSLTDSADVAFQIRVKLPDTGDDSFYYKLDSSGWQVQNNQTYSAWQTLQPTTFSSVSAGTHTLYIQRREYGAQLDRVILKPSSGTITYAGTADVTPDFSHPVYVSNDGSDYQGNGTKSKPYRTLTKVAKVATAGTTVLVHGGTYSENDITPANSGKEGSYIVFRPWPGTGTVTVKYPSYISDVTPLFNLSGKNYIWIEGFQFKGYTKGLSTIYVSAGNNNVVTNNRFIDLGNKEVGKWNGNHVVGLFNSSNNVVCNNYFENIYGDGVGINSQKSQQNLVCQNTFKTFKGKLRSWGGSYLYSRAIDVQDMSDGNNVVAFNHAEDVYHHIWLDRDGSNNVILRNYGRDGSGNVFNESRCKKNLIQENISVGMTSGYMTAYYTSTGWTEKARWIGNVAYKNTVGFTIHKSKQDEFRNNITYNNTKYNLIYTDAARNNGPHVFKNNLWYTAGKSQSIQFGGIPSATESGGSTYPGSDITVAAFQNNVSESGGLSVNPLFYGSDDFRLKSNSPAKNAGDNGQDLGVYAYYPGTSTGWNADAESADTIIYFDQLISAAERGKTVSLTVKLNRASAYQVKASVKPIAGDAEKDTDFTLSGSYLIFKPGETSKTVKVTTKGYFDYDELVAFRIQDVVNASASGRNLRVLRVKAR